MEGERQVLKELVENQRGPDAAEEDSGGVVSSTTGASVRWRRERKQVKEERIGMGVGFLGREQTPAAIFEVTCHNTNPRQIERILASL